MMQPIPDSMTMLQSVTLLKQCRATLVPIIGEHNVTHKTGSTQCNTTPPEKDRAMTTGNKHKKLDEVQMCGS